MTTSQTPQVPTKSSACAWTILLLVAFMETAHAEVPFDPPGTYSTSWLGNTYMDADGHKNVTEELADLCLSPNGKIFTAGYAETWGGGAEYQADDGSFIARYDRFESGFGDPVKAVAADSHYVFWGTPGKGLLRSASWWWRRGRLHDFSGRENSHRTVCQERQALRQQFFRGENSCV